MAVISICAVDVVAPGASRPSTKIGWVERGRLCSLA